MAERLHSRDVRLILICLLVCAASLWVGVSCFHRAFPEASIDFRVDRISSRPAAERFLLSQGIRTAGYMHASAFRYDDESKVFLERELGLAKTDDLVRGPVKLWRWGHRWFKPKRREEIRAEVTPSGQLASFVHVLPEDAPGADLSAAAARALAESFLVLDMKRPIDSLEFLDSQSVKMPRRTDHLLSWKVAGVGLGPGSYRVTVRVQGDRIGGYDEALKIPEDWRRGYARLRSLNETATQFDLILIALLALGMLVAFGRHLRVRGIRWRTAFMFGAVCFLLQLFSSLNDFPIAQYGFDTSGSYGSFLGRSILASLASALLYGGIVLCLTAAAEPLYRQSFPGQLSITRMFSWQGIRTRSFLVGSLAGITLTCFFFAYEIGFYLLANRLGAWAPADVPYSDLLNTRFPWTFVLLGGFFPAVSEEWMFRAFSIPFLHRILKHRWAAVLLASFVWGFGHASYPNQPFFIRGVEVGILGLVLSWAMFRFGILAPLVAHYSIDAFYSAFLLLRSGSPYLVASGAVTAGIPLIPVLVAGTAYLIRREFRQEHGATNAADPAPQAVTPAPPPSEAPSLPPYRPLGRRRAVSAMLLLLAGIVSLKFYAPHFGGGIRFRLSASDAESKARSFLAGLGFDLGGYRCAAEPQNRVDPSASQYVYAFGGVPGLNSMYGPQMVPLVWQTRCYRPLQKEEFQVSIDPDGGKAVAFRHNLGEDAPAAAVSSRRAEQIVSAFAASKGYDLSRFRIRETLTEKHNRRADAFFIWEALPKTSGAVGDARLNLHAGVSGDRISSWNQSVRIPEDSMRSRESRNYYGSIILVFRTILVIVLLWTAMGRLMKAARAGQVRWRLAGQIAAAAMALEIVNTANRVPLLVFPYDTQIDMRVYLFTSLAEELLLLIGIGAAAALAAAIIMACYPQAGRALSRPAVDLWGRDCLPCAAALVGFYLLLRCAASQLEFHASQRMLAPVLPIPANIGTWIPFVSIVHDGALGAFFLTALLALVAGVWFRLSGHPFWRGAYAFCLLASLLPSSARHNPELLAGAIPMLLLTGTVVLMVVFLRNNLLAYPACAAALSLTRMTLLASVRGGEGLILQTLAAAALMIGALVLLSRGRRIHTSAVSRRNFMPRVR